MIISNGKEQQEQTLYYDYGFRQYEPQLGRWHVIDALAEKYFSESPYSYAGNDPVNKYDVAGLQYYWKKEEWQSESHFSGGGIMYSINYWNNRMGYMLNTARYYTENVSLTGTVNGVQGTSVNDVLTFNFNDDGTFSINTGQNFSGFYGHDGKYIYSLYIDGIGRFNFKDGIKISSIIKNGNINWGGVLKYREIEIFSTFEAIDKSLQKFVTENTVGVGFSIDMTACYPVGAHAEYGYYKIHDKEHTFFSSGWAFGVEASIGFNLLIIYQKGKAPTNLLEGEGFGINGNFSIFSVGYDSSRYGESLIGYDIIMIGVGYGYGGSIVIDNTTVEDY